MNINYELYKAYRRATQDQPKESYCFVINSFLGENGRLKDHPLVGKHVINIDTDTEYMHNFGKVYIIESVSIHWHMGYYYVLLIRDKKDSHGIINYANINSISSIIIDSIDKDNNRYEFLSF